MSNRKSIYVPRRQVIRGLLAAGAFGATSRIWTACTPQETQSGSNSPGTSSPSSDKPLVVGFIYVGAKDDYGYNQAHAEGAAAVAKLPGVKIVEQASVPETTDVQETMRNMIEQDGATILFPTSFGYFDPHIVKMAAEYPEVQFFHYGALYDASKHPKNIGSYFGDVDEGQYICGRVAAMTSKSGKLGFVAAKPITPVLRNINGFILGARSVKPNITVQVIFTGDWSQPVKEAEATNSLADQGIDVVSVHVDSPKVVIETAEKRGIYSSGFHAVQSALAPKGYLTGAAWDFPSAYSEFVEKIKAGKTLMNGGIPHLSRGGLKEKYVKLAPFGPAVSEAAKKDAEEMLAKANDGTLVVYKGGTKDNTGKEVIPTGKDLKITDSALDKTDWLAEGVIGKVKG
ncbi:BMP family ABC transporter substrate-binding protein [Leptolyngbya sp. 'hensonii']|uniref:BMP family ABC transporter substrate-binding protein n=1 Tax=Leptolyngbya sp. 'hensonii' TaxID=1922337 RepID=UPI00094FF326|nr:BMP family ABC transporter substrate-binding protein [Leptolyngbya sp. 'hensonii']OLP20402.1 BMP family ABC transporter substrate-binding protein [Leptolyngbya sp. 'hensonii']